MRIIQEKTTYYSHAFIFDYNFEVVQYCKHLQEKYGWKSIRWYENAWRFNDPNVAIALRQRYPQVEIEPQLKTEIELAELMMREQEIIEQNALRIKASQDSSLQSIKGIKADLKPYQKLGVEFFVNNKGRGILADEQGTGKTLQSISYLVHTAKNKALIIVPASVKYNWENEIYKWSKKTAFVVTSKTKAEEILMSDADMIIINYDILDKHLGALSKIKFDALVADEAHYIKTPKSKRAKAVRAISRGIPSILFLSGTPLLNRPIELYNMLTILDPTTWNNFYDFAVKYCDGHMGRYGFEAKGATKIDELYQRINKYFLRRTKKDVLKELPPKIYTDYAVALDDATFRKYKLAEEQFAIYLRDVKKKKAGDIARAVMAEKLVKLGELRQLTTKGKIDAARELIQQIIDGGEKVIVFSVYNEPLDTLHEEFKNSVKLVGSVGAEERTAMVKKFQEDPNCMVFFGGMKSAGVGITLTAASNVIFIDYSWVPADHAQAQDRAHRIGATAECINVYQLYSKGTIDEYMVKLLAKKQEIFDKLIEGKDAKSGSNVVGDLLSMLEKK